MLLDPRVLAEILGAAIDEDTLGRLDDSKVDIKEYDLSGCGSRIGTRRCRAE